MKLSLIFFHGTFPILTEISQINMRNVDRCDDSL